MTIVMDLWAAKKMSGSDKNHDCRTVEGQCASTIVAFYRLCASC
jgi:hypothetical protein